MNTWRMIGSFLRTAGRHRHVAVDRHVAPAQQHLPLGLDRALHLLLAGQARGVLLGQEDHADTVFAGCGQRDALGGHLLAVQRIGQLDQDAGAVTHQLVGTDCAPVVEVLQDLEGVLDDGVGLGAADVGNKTHTTGIVFVAGGVQAVLFQMLDFVSGCRHGMSLG
jgi:hypothetical protein